MRRVFLVLLIAVLAGGCALRGFEAAGVVAGNQALVNALGVQTQMAFQPLYAAVPGYGNIPVCRLQDLADLPRLNNAAVVRVDKSGWHKTFDTLSGAAIAGMVVYLATGDSTAGWIGAAGGAGGGFAVANHEYDLCLFWPVAVPISPAAQPAPPPTQQPAQPAPVMPSPPREVPVAERIRV